MKYTIFHKNVYLYHLLEEYIGDKWKGTHTQENVCAIDLEFLTTPTCKLGLW